MGTNYKSVGIITFNKPITQDLHAHKSIMDLGGLFPLSDDQTIMFVQEDSKCKLESYLTSLIEVLKPLDYVVNGKVDVISEYMDLYGVFVVNNKVTVKQAQKIIYKKQAVSKWNLKDRVFNLIPFHIPTKLVNSLITDPDACEKFSMVA